MAGIEMAPLDRQRQAPRTTAAPSEQDLRPILREVLRLYRAAWTVAAIAERLGVRPSTVASYASWLRRHGYSIPGAPSTGGVRGFDYTLAARLYRAGHRQIDIARQLGVGPRAVSRALTLQAEAGVRLGKLGRWPNIVSTAELYERALLVGAAGAGAEFGMSATVVEKRLAKARLSLMEGRRQRGLPLHPAREPVRTMAEAGR